MKAWDPARGRDPNGQEFEGGGATRFGYVLHRYPERRRSRPGNYVYGQGSGLDRIHAWFRLEKRPEGEMALVWSASMPPAGRRRVLARCA